MVFETNTEVFCPAGGGALLLALILAWIFLKDEIGSTELLRVKASSSVDVQELG